MVLYPLVFRHIIIDTNKTASSGLLQPDVIRRRKQRNILNIYMTFWTWVFQFTTSLLSLIFIYFIFGKHKFYQHMFAILNVGVNFMILPSLFVIMGDEDFKKALTRRNYVEAAKLFISWSESLSNFHKYLDFTFKPLKHDCAWLN